MWHGYFVVERGTLGFGNWAALQALYEAMGSHGTTFPAHNTHWRTRLDGDAVIYESLFDPNEVSIDSFVQLLANEFGVPVGDIEYTVSVTTYGSGYPTTVWEFLYGSIIRFTVRRFGQGGTWEESRQETLAYMATYMVEWEPIQA